MSTNVPYQDTTALGVYLEQGPAPAGGAVFSLSIKSGEAARITFPSTVTLSEGETGRQFEIAWASAGTTILQAQLTEYDGVPVTGTIFEETIVCEEQETCYLVGPNLTGTMTDPIQRSGEYKP